MDGPYASVSQGDDDPYYQPRRAQRILMEQPIMLRLEGGATQDAILIDLSVRGFQAVCDSPVLIGSYVALDLPGIGPVQAQVRWQLGKRMGARFVDMVSMHRCTWVDTGA